MPTPITVDTTAETSVRAMSDEAAATVLAIYEAGLDTGLAHRHVAVDTAGTVVGWVAASPVSTRPVYAGAGVVEHSVYVHPDAKGRGIGRLLLETLIASTEAAGIWTIQSGVFPENAASLALHARVGFRVVGTRERIGQHHGRWREVVFIERRSPHVI